MNINISKRQIVPIDLGTFDDATVFLTEWFKDPEFGGPRCDSCGKEIKDEYLVAAVRTCLGRFLVHHDCCDPHTKCLIEIHEDIRILNVGLMDKFKINLQAMIKNQAVKNLMPEDEEADT